ncbi:ferredoxin [Patescibacteria group bacterium]|nr:MAG: ferredoxin [Patescibacteria group bacterium]
MIPQIDEEKCIGCGTCPALAPGTFRMRDDNKAEVYNEKGDEDEAIKMAAEACPTQAILILPPL